MTDLTVRRSARPSARAARRPAGALARGGALTRRRGRGAQMLEFALLLPLWIALALFTLDMGHLVLLTGALQDSAFSAARAGAQVGGGGSGTAGPSYAAMQQAVSEIPGGQVDQLRGFTVTTGTSCASTGPNAYVTVKATYAAPTIVPGLGALLNLFSSGSGDAVPGSWTLHATAVARCEVVR